MPAIPTTNEQTSSRMVTKMKKINAFAVGVTLVLSLAGCDKAPPANTEVVGQSAPADKLLQDIAKDNLPSQVGIKKDGAIVSDGRSGYLVYGPYSPLIAGSYSATFVGSVESLAPGTGITIDVVSAKGNVVHAKQEMSYAGELPALKFNLASDAQDLEVRILAPEGGIVKLKSYSIAKN